MNYNLHFLKLLYCCFNLSVSAAFLNRHQRGGLLISGPPPSKTQQGTQHGYHLQHNLLSRSPCPSSLIDNNKFDAKFVVCASNNRIPTARRAAIRNSLGEFEVSLTKPLGIILEECDSGNRDGTDQASFSSPPAGVQIASTVEGSAAELNGLVRGDKLVKIFDQDVANSDFDSIMTMLVDASSEKPISLTWSDGLGRMDMAPNLAKTLQLEDALLADAVVRAAVREIRGSALAQGKLGDLLRVEIVIGAGVRNDGSCMVRFFAIFTRDSVTTFSCSVSATGVPVSLDGGDGAVDIVALSCAKDEGWGQTVDLIVESK